MTNHVRSYGILFPSCAIAVLFLAAPASAQWVVPGASGVPDESSATAIMFNDNGTVSLKSGVTGAHLRYPVVNAKGLDWAPTCGQVPDGTPCSNDPTALCMRTTIRDTGTNARVVVKLQEIPYWFPDNAGSRVNTLMTIDSDTAITEGSGPTAARLDRLSDGGPVRQFRPRPAARFLEQRVLCRCDAHAQQHRRQPRGEGAALGLRTVMRSGRIGSFTVGGSFHRYADTARPT